MGDIIIEEANYKAFIMALGELFMLIASIASTVYGILRRMAQYRITGLIFSMVFLIVFIITILKTVKTKSLLTITREGLIDNSSSSNMGYIPFRDIEAFEITKSYKNVGIGILPKDSEGFLAKLPAAKRLQVKRNIYLKLPPVIINVDLAKDMEPEDILTLLQKRLRDYNSLYE